ncbi:MAG: asparaginase [Cyanobacteriota bacterium]|jgi:L-asparaginase
MSRGKRPLSSPIEVQVLREGILESVHLAEAAVCDDRVRLLQVAGSGETTAFIRSALKPFQALAATSSGALERFGLSDKDLAIICSSHHGQIQQARQVFNILWRADIEPSALQCPVPPQGQSPLHHNCSGKHAGMLAVCQQRNWPLNTYLHKNHPVQQLILQKISELLGMPGAELISARDDCGAPTYSMELSQMASLYAQLASGNQVDLERVARAMTYYPQLVSAEGSFDTELMRLMEGELVSKAGAEGIQCVAKVGDGVGLAIKVRDGSKRAKYGVAIRLLQQMGWIPPRVAEHLSDRFMMVGAYQRLDVLGELTLL